jgi:sulfonate transport system substrate-binding protein
VKYLRRCRVPVTAVLAVATVTIVTSPAFAASTASSVQVPAGTTLNVADQLDGLETPLHLSGQATKIPYTVSYSSFLGAPAVFQAFQSGDVDFSTVGDAGIIPPQEANQSFVVVAASESTGANFGLEVAPGEKITSVKQLRGKKIGYAAGTNTQSFVLQLLKDNGLTPKEVSLVNLPSSAGAAAVRAGDVDVAVTEEPLLAEYQVEYPGAKVILTPGVYSGLTFYVATKSAVANAAKSAAIADYLQRLVRADNWVDAHEAAYISAYYGTYLKLPASTLPPLVEAAKSTKFVPISAAVINKQQETTNLFAAAGALPGHLDVAKVFTTKFNKYVAAAQ